MKIGKCLVSCDANPLYIDFFPLVFRAWRDILGIEVELALISDEIPSELIAFKEHITLFPPIRDVHTGFQAQCARLLLPQLCKVEEDQAVIISDIDMVPMNRRYYIKLIAKISSDKFVVYRSNKLRENREIAICYNAATPKTWGDLFGKVENMVDAESKIKLWHGAVKYEGIHGGGGWSTDQELLFSKVEDFEKDRIVRLRDRQLGFARLDRSKIKGKLSFRQKFLIMSRYYSDCHMKRPYSEFVDLNENIVDITSGSFFKKFD